jgi:hypothetical protein
MGKGFLDLVAEAMSIDETVECDNVLRWDGDKLYVTEQVYSAGRKSRERKQDVTDEVICRLFVTGLNG